MAKNEKTVQVQGKLFFCYTLNNLNKNKWNEKNPDSWRYEMHLGQLDDTTINRLDKELNVKVKTKDDDKYGLGEFIRCKSRFPFTLEDTEGNKIDPADVGEGTVAVVTLTSYDHDMSNKYGWSPQALGGKTRAHITVKELVQREKAEA